MAELKPCVLEAWRKENDAVLKELNLDCKTSVIGNHKCSVQTRYGWCCDVCLENELLWLYSQGIHTINSCCGHGEKGLASILVVGEESKNRMNEMGYSLAEIQTEDCRMAAYVPKTQFPYEAWNRRAGDGK